MNPETTEILNLALRKAIDVASKTGEFVVEQTPDVVQQLIVFNTAAYATKLAIGVTITGALGWLIKKIIKHIDDFEEFGIVTTFASGVGIVLMLMFSVIPNLFNLMKITLAPKVWLLEYAASLIK